MADVEYQMNYENDDQVWNCEDCEKNMDDNSSNNSTHIFKDIQQSQTVCKPQVDDSFDLIRLAMQIISKNDYTHPQNQFDQADDELQIIGINKGNPSDSTTKGKKRKQNSSNREEAKIKQPKVNNPLIVIDVDEKQSPPPLPSKQHRTSCDISLDNIVNISTGRASRQKAELAMKKNFALKSTKTLVAKK